MPTDLDFERMERRKAGHRRYQEHLARSPLLRWLNKNDPERVWTGFAIIFVVGLALGFIAEVLATLLIRLFVWIV
jgi:hypothetical protein